jgi:cation:H+ antiporter
MLTFWIIVFVISLLLVVKSSDWLLESAEKIGLRMGLSPFIIGITIVAFGTSFPELVSSLFAVLAGVTEIVTANAVGSNIANILLVAGIAAIVGKKLEVTKDLIDLDLPLIAISTAIFVMVAFDGSVNIVESIILLVVYVVYLVFALVYKKTKVESIRKPQVKPRDIIMLLVGIAGLAVGANYLIESIIYVSEALNIVPAVITITVVALGTSFPELLVSIKAALKNKSDVALGNIFGSNVFNVLAVVGIPGLFGTLTVDAKTLTLGIPVLIIATVLFIFSGISKRIHVQEGILYVFIYFLFIAKLFELF